MLNVGTAFAKSTAGSARSATDNTKVAADNAKGASNAKVTSRNTKSAGTPKVASDNTKSPDPAKNTALNGIRILQTAYPDLNISADYDTDTLDYFVSFTNPDTWQKFQFYWAGGSLLPKEELENQDKYWSILYSYPKELFDPADMTDEQKARLKEFGSKSNRRNGSGTPMFFFDAVYSSDTRLHLEQQITRIDFLGKKSTVHKRITGPLAEVNKEILALAEYDEETADFVAKIKSTDAYYWRMIDGTNRKSFHSLGIAIDILPVRITGEIFWSWARDKNPENWMLTPLKRRWLPPEKVVEIFEKHGFIWGGKWAIWDNMHFEYHPELILYNKITPRFQF